MHFYTDNIYTRKIKMRFSTSVLLLTIGAAGVYSQTIGTDSCIGELACHSTDAISEISDHSCNGYKSCYEVKAIIGNNSCNEQTACEYVGWYSDLINIGASSCLGIDSCFGIKANVGNSSCIGQDSCKNYDGSQGGKSRLLIVHFLRVRLLQTQKYSLTLFELYQNIYLFSLLVWQLLLYFFSRPRHSEQLPICCSVEKRTMWTGSKTAGWQRPVPKSLF